MEGPNRLGNYRMRKHLNGWRDEGAREINHITERITGDFQILGEENGPLWWLVVGNYLCSI